jgi:hypothetical protein
LPLSPLPLFLSRSPACELVRKLSKSFRVLRCGHKRTHATHKMVYHVHINWYIMYRAGFRHILTCGHKRTHTRAHTHTHTNAYTGAAYIEWRCGLVMAWRVPGIVRFTSRSRVTWARPTEVTETSTHIVCTGVCMWHVRGERKSMLVICCALSLSLSLSLSPLSLFLSLASRALARARAHTFSLARAPARSLSPVRLLSHPCAFCDWCVGVGGVMRAELLQYCAMPSIASFINSLIHK